MTRLKRFLKTDLLVFADDDNVSKLADLDNSGKADHIMTDSQDMQEFKRACFARTGQMDSEGDEGQPTCSTEKQAWCMHQGTGIHRLMQIEDRGDDAVVSCPTSCNLSGEVHDSVRFIWR